MYDFELNLLELTNKHPKYSEIGHNFGLILQLDFKSILDNATDEKSLLYSESINSLEVTRM